MRRIIQRRRRGNLRSDAINRSERNYTARYRNQYIMRHCVVRYRRRRRGNLRSDLHRKKYHTTRCRIKEYLFDQNTFPQA